MEAYFEANPAAKKFRDTPPAFLDLMQELFDGVLATGGYARSIDEAIESSIDPKLLSAAASQASGLVDEEDEEEAEEAEETKETEETEEEVDEASKLESARSSIEGSQLSSPSAEHSSPSRFSSTPSQPSSLAMWKRAIEQATRATKSSVKRQRGRRRVAEALKETVEKVTREMRATRELIAQKSPQEKASTEFIHEFSDLDPVEQLAVLRAFKTESTAKLFLVTAGVAELRQSLINDILAGRKEDV